MREDERRYAELPFLTRYWYRLSGFLVAYGYKVHQMLPWLIIMMAASTLMVYSGRSSDSFIPVQPDLYSASSALPLSPTASPSRVPALSPKAGATAPPTSSQCNDSYPCLEPIVYVFDAMIPIANFHQSDYWQPKASWLGRWPFIILTIAVWFAITVFVSAITSVARREHEQSV
jgi:hypothetical protein